MIVPPASTETLPLPVCAILSMVTASASIMSMAPAPVLSTSRLVTEMSNSLLAPAVPMPVTASRVSEPPEILLVIVVVPDSTMAPTVAVSVIAPLPAAVMLPTVIESAVRVIEPDVVVSISVAVNASSVVTSISPPTVSTSLRIRPELLPSELSMSRPPTDSATSTPTSIFRPAAPPESPIVPPASNVNVPVVAIAAPVSSSSLIVPPVTSDRSWPTTSTSSAVMFPEVASPITSEPVVVMSPSSAFDKLNAPAPVPRPIVTAVEGANVISPFTAVIDADASKDTSSAITLITAEPVVDTV